MKDALQPVAELIAEMPSKTKGKREEWLKPVSLQAVGALGLLLKDVDRVRAVVYRLDDTVPGMSVLAYYGRGDTPSAFVRGTERGDRACKLVADGQHHFQRDTKDGTPPAFQGSGNGYTTFISASIHTGESGYGMVTVDAPTAGDLVDTDCQIIMLVADLLAISFAIADRA